MGWNQGDTLNFWQHEEMRRAGVEVQVRLWVVLFS